MMVLLTFASEKKEVMETIRSATTHYIEPGKFLLLENALGNPDLIQCSVSSDCRITIIDQKNFPLDELEQWPVFRLTTSDIKLNNGEGPYNIYIVVPTPKNTSTNSASIGYSIHLIDRDGYRTLEGGEKELVGSVLYKYYYAGTVSAQGGKPDAETTPAGRGRVIEMDLGVTPPATDIPGSLYDYDKIFEIDKVDPSNSNSWLLTILSVIKSMTVRILTVTNKIIFHKDSTSKELTDIALESDSGKEDYYKNDIIASTAWVIKEFDTLNDRFLFKNREDTALELISFLNGINVTNGIVTDTITATELSSNIVKVLDKLTADNAAFSGNISSVDYAEKLLGWLITPSGDIDAKSLRLRDFLEVPELRYNRVSVITGEEWNAPGGGIIESVDEENSIVYLKLEPGEVAAIEVDDICKANFNNYTGFQTTYFRITEKLDNGSFKYVLRSGYTYHPQKAMHFVCYGNFTNAERQKSSYSTQNYIRFLKGVNNWEITKDMIAMQLGDLSNLKLFGMDMTGHSAYLNRIYMTGTIKQISNDGVTEVPVPAFKGEWKAGTYWYYDEVTHNGSTWICIESTTTQEPSDSSTDWLKVVSKGENGTSGKGVKSIVEQYYLSTSQTSLTGGSWSTTPPTWEKGKYIWTRSVITYTDDSTTTTDPISVTGGAGENGLGVKSVDVFYYLSSSSSELIGGEWSTIAPTWVNGKYMWSKTKTTYTDDTFVESNPVCITGEKGEDGKDGKGVQSVDVLYYLSSSSTSLSGGSWSTDSPTWVDGKYIWSKTKVVYTDGSSIETNPACITGGKGNTGDDGRGISSIVEEYYLSTSSNSLVGGSWSTTPPTWENGKYIWTRSVITYTDGTSTTTNPICSTGSTGETGIGVKSVEEQYYQSTSYSTPTGGSWQTSVPAWQDGKYIWTRVVITYTDNTYTETDPVCVTGGKGPSGNDGVGISAVDVLFYLSTSSSSLEGGSWSTTSPKWEDGKYLWTKTKVTYTNGSTWESDPACITGSQGKTGLPGAMLRPRGVWKANTEYYNNETFIDTVIYDGQNKLCKITHTSTSSFDSTKWEEFSEFENVATNVLLAQNATIDVLGTSGIFVGNLDKTQGWIMTEGSIKHNVTGVELTSDGKISLPETGGMTVGGKTFIEAGKIKTEFIDVDTLEVTHLKGAIGSFKKLTANYDNGDEAGSITFSTPPLIDTGVTPGASLSLDFASTWFGGDLYQQGYNYDESRSWRFYASDIWCRGQFGHYQMTTLTMVWNANADMYAHIYGNGTDLWNHKYPQPGQPIDCVVMQGDGQYVLRICDSPMYKMLVIVNFSEYAKRVVTNNRLSTTITMDAWSAKAFITADTYSGVNNLYPI